VHSPAENAWSTVGSLGSDGCWTMSWRWQMGDKGKKDKEKGQKQHAEKDKQQERQKLDKQPKRRI